MHKRAFVNKGIDRANAGEGYFSSWERILVTQQQHGCKFSHRQQDIDMLLFDQLSENINELFRI
jgi:hypothetical protein